MGIMQSLNVTADGTGLQMVIVSMKISERNELLYCHIQHVVRLCHVLCG
jgi:hypothetical protein